MGRAGSGSPLTPSPTTDHRSVARQNRWEGVPTLLPLCPPQRQLCARHQGPLVRSHEPFSSTQPLCRLPWVSHLAHQGAVGQRAYLGAYPTKSHSGEEQSWDFRPGSWGSGGASVRTGAGSTLA